MQNEVVHDHWNTYKINKNLLTSINSTRFRENRYVLSKAEYDMRKSSRNENT